MQAWRNLIRAHAVVTGELEGELIEKVGLSLAWYEVLLRLQASAHGKLRMSDLADSMLVAQSSVTRLIDRMERAGLVRREPNLLDRRVTMVAMTEEGQRLYARARPIHLRGVAERFGAHVDAEDAETLRRIMRQVLEGNGRSEGETRRAQPRPGVGRLVGSPS
jgi:DNA-binding MarR family transcriptional regulator